MSGAAPTEAASAGRLAIPAQQQQFLAFDFGSKRTGVASGNRLLGLASPVTTIQAEGAEARFAAVQQLLAQWQPQALVIGVPYHPDGAVVADEAHGMALDVALRAHGGHAVAGLEFEQFGTIHQPRDNLAHVHRLAQVCGHQGEQIVGGQGGAGCAGSWGHIPPELRDHIACQADGLT